MIDPILVASLVLFGLSGACLSWTGLYIVRKIGQELVLYREAADARGKAEEALRRAGEILRAAEEGDSRTLNELLDRAACPGEG